MKPTLSIPAKVAGMLVMILVYAVLSLPVAGTMQVERLNRGLIAVRVGQGYYLSWRLLANEPYNTGFYVYRGTTRLNSAPITGATIYTDANAAVGSAYTVRAVVNGAEQPASEQAIIIANMEGSNAGYLQIPLQRPAAGPQGGTYSPNDGSVGDLNGDGVYEIVLKWDPDNSKDNAQAGITDNVIIDAYTLTGTRLWRIDLGPNIRAGAHYTQFMVYDFDGCGKAEVMMKTAPGTRDGTGAFIRLGPAANADHNAIYRNANGHIVTGPEYLTVFEGATGKELATVNYWPVAGTVSGWGGGSSDNGGNRVNRFNAVVAYLDGVRPTAVFQRGYYERMTFAAWDWRNGQLTQRWTFDSNTSGNSAYAGQGNHQLSVADVDNSGRHSIITGSSVIKYDGTGFHTKGYGHGDAMHVAHMIKGNPIPQIYMVHEGGSIGSSLRHANNGNVIFTINNSGDVGRGVAAELDAAMPGFKFWDSGSNSLYNLAGTRVGDGPNNGNNSSATGNKVYNFVIWWTGALTRANLDGDKIATWNIQTNTGSRILTATGASSNNGTKATPVLTADIFGDWREEVIYNYGNTALRLYTTTMTTTHRLVTMMHDPVYRVAVAWQNSSYNQPPHPGYYIASDMNFPPPTLDVAVVGGGTVIPPDPCAANPGSTACCSANPTHSSCVIPPDPCVANPGSAACCTANPTHSSCQPPPPTWAFIGRGTLIDSLILFDPPNAASWSIQTNFRAPVKAYGDREYSTVSVPTQLQGAEWVAPAMDTRSRTAPDTLVRFKARQACTVYVAHEDRVSPRPAWLAARGFTATSLQVTVNDNQADRVFTVYRRAAALNQIVALGPNSTDGSGTSMMYLIAARAPTTSALTDRAKVMANSLSITRAGSGAFRVNYSLKDKGSVRINLFDIKGNKVRTLVNTSMDAGTYQDHFSVDGLANGVYLIKMNAGKQTLREKVIIGK